MNEKAEWILMHFAGVGEGSPGDIRYFIGGRKEETGLI